MDEKELKEVEELLDGAVKDLEEGKVEEGKVKVAAAKNKVKKPTIGGGANGLPVNK